MHRGLSEANGHPHSSGRGRPQGSTAADDDGRPHSADTTAAGKLGPRTVGYHIRTPPSDVGLTSPGVPKTDQPTHHTSAVPGTMARRLHRADPEIRRGHWTRFRPPHIPYRSTDEAGGGMDGAENQEGLSQAPTRHGSGVASATERTPESTTVLRLGRGKGVPPCSRAAHLLHPDDDYPAAAVPVDQHRRQRSIPERPNGFHGAALRDDGHVRGGQAARLSAAHRHKEQDSSAGATRFLSLGGERQDGDTPRRRALPPEILVVAGPALGVLTGDGDGGRAWS